MTTGSIAQRCREAETCLSKMLRQDRDLSAVAFRFEGSPVFVNAQALGRVGEALDTGRLQVWHLSELPFSEPLLYQRPCQYLKQLDVFSIPWRFSAVSFGWHLDFRALLLHEAVHALADGQRWRIGKVGPEEAAAYLAQFLYGRKAAGQRHTPTEMAEGSTLVLETANALIDRYGLLGAEPGAVTEIRSTDVARLAQTIEAMPVYRAMQAAVDDGWLGDEGRAATVGRLVAGRRAP
jgi:hypothetical protein